MININSKIKSGCRIFLSIIIVLSSLTSLFCSCGSLKSDENPSSANTQNNTSDPVKENTENQSSDGKKENLNNNGTDLFDSIPKEDYGGREFIILTTDPDFTDSETDSGILGKELYERNRAIEEKFNIKITALTIDENEIQSYLNNYGSADSDIPACDLLYAPMNIISSCGGNGLLMNIYSVPYFSFYKEYTDPELISALSQSDTTYGVYGKAAYDTRSAWCVYYNKDVLASLGYEDPYSMVKDGTWTWDMFLSIAEASAADLDGDGRMIRNNDRYGYSSSMNTSLFANAVFASFGKHFFSRDEEGFFKMDFAVTDEDNYVQEIRNICVSNSSKYPVRNPGSDALEAFSQGRLTFFCEKLSYASTLAYSPINWGILPMPKRNASQTDYFSWIDSSVCGYAVPYGVQASDLSGKVLDAIYAYNYCRGENIIELAWTYYYMRDNASAAMISQISESAVYDAAYAFGEGMPDFSIASYELLQSVIEQNLNFTYLYTQSEQPFSDFMRREFVN